MLSLQHLEPSPSGQSGLLKPKVLDIPSSLDIPNSYIILLYNIFSKMPLISSVAINVNPASLPNSIISSFFVHHLFPFVSIPDSAVQEPILFVNL